MKDIQWFVLNTDLAQVVVYLNSESVEIDENFSKESFECSWQQAMTNETVPLSELWIEI